MTNYPDLIRTISGYDPHANTGGRTRGDTGHHRVYSLGQVAPSLRRRCRDTGDEEGRAKRFFIIMSLLLSLVVRLLTTGAGAVGKASVITLPAPAPRV